MNELKALAANKEVDFSNLQFRQNHDYYRARLKAEIARSLWGTERYYQVLLIYDNQYLEALKMFYEIENLLIPDKDKEFVNK